jgi:triacylglycerol lipase
MLARAQQVITISWLAATIGWLVYFLSQGRPGVALIGALLIASVHALVLGLEFLLLRFINRGDPAPPATVRDLLRAWWGEVCTATLVFGWRQPYCSTHEPDHLPDSARGRRGVVLVHGFVCNRGLWNPWMCRLRAAGVPFVALNLEPVLGSIERYPALIEAAVRRVEDATGEPPLIVAHSMGGLAVRAWFNAYDGDARVHSVVTIGSPHNGTWMARFGLVHNAREMRQGGDWLLALAQQEPAARRARFTCFYSHCDNIVLPASTATLPGADNRHVPGVAHVQLVFQDVVFDEVLCRLTANSRSPGNTTPASIAGAARSAR